APVRPRGLQPKTIPIGSSFQFSSIAALTPFNNPNSLRARQHRRAGKTDEQSVFDDTWNGAQQSRQILRPGYAAKMGVDNPVATVSDENVAILPLSDHHWPGNSIFGKRAADGALGRRQPERNDLDRQGKATERLDPFRIVRNHDHAVG